MTTLPTLSPELLGANRRLLALRQKQRCGTPRDEHPEETAVAVPDERAAVPGPNAALSLSQCVADLPPHLGWESTAVSAHLRGRKVGASKVPASPSEPIGAPPLIDPAAANSHDVIRTPQSSIRLYPDLALALLRSEKVAAGRLWLLMRALDETGRGWWEQRDLYAMFCDDAALYPLCSRRHLRTLLAQGDGLFWQGTENGRFWLRGQLKVAQALGIGRMQYKPVALPLIVLLGAIGDVRAHFYASFHSSRNDKGGPIARDTLRDLSGASRRTQQAYEQRAGVQVLVCISLGAPLTAVTTQTMLPVALVSPAKRQAVKRPPASNISKTQEHAWRSGRAGFRLKDVRGCHGKPGQHYFARRLPNSYTGPHRPLSTHSCRRLNRQLIDLPQQGNAGNGQPAKSSAPGWRQDRQRSRRYYPDGATAAKWWNRASGRRLVYWRGHKGARGVAIWYSLPQLAS